MNAVLHFSGFTLLEPKIEHRMEILVLNVFQFLLNEENLLVKLMQNERKMPKTFQKGRKLLTDQKTIAYHKNRFVSQRQRLVVRPRKVQNCAKISWNSMLNICVDFKIRFDFVLLCPLECI